MRLWFNGGLSGVYHAVRLIKEDLGAGVFVLATGADKGAPVRAVADRFEDEPSRLSDAEYVRWLATECQRHAITHLWAQRRARLVAESAGTLREVGTTVIAAASPETYLTLESKARTYEALAGSSVPIPEARVASSVQELNEAFDRLLGAGEQICVKPNVSMFGHGFRRVVAESDPLRRLLTNDTVTVSRGELLSMLANSDKRPSFLVMPYLEGPEYSIDCLGSSGRLIAYVARRKHATSRGQQLIVDPAIGRTVAELTERFGLNALYNIQLRQHRDRLWLLEINARMSGGIAVACQSGLNLPAWAVRLAMGEDPAGVPKPRSGVVVSQIDTPVVLTEVG